jgi:hypothetical protein
MKLILKILFIVMALTLSTINSFAQTGFVFKVLATSGSVEIKTADSWKALKSGASLFEADEIKLVGKAYVGLIHTSGRSKELMKGGVYKAKDLAKTMVAGPSVMGKYVDFILSKNTDEAKQNRLIAVGSVTRTSFREDILIYLPENQHADILNNKVVVKWESKSDTPGPFRMTIQNLSGDKLLVIESSAPAIFLDLSRAELKSDSYFLVDIKNMNDLSLGSPQYLIKRLQKADQQFNDQVALIKQEMKEESAMNKIILAGFYEDNHLLIDAIATYEEAIELAPEVPFYREAYEEFLLRNRLKFPKE